MENDLTESQTRNAATVAGFAAAIALTATGVLQAKRYVSRRVHARRLTPAHLTKAE